MTIDLDALERIAQAATPGPWEWEPPSEDDWPSADQSLVTSRPGSDGYRDVVVAGWGYDASGTDASDEDRAHIAAFDPPTALALIARVRELEAIVNDGGKQAAKYWTRLTAAERALEAERANVKRVQAEALREAAEALTESTSELNPNNGYELAYINCTAIDVRELLSRADRIESEVPGV